MPAKSRKQERVMQAIEHGWRPSKGSLKDISPATASKILGKGESGSRHKPYVKGSNTHRKQRR